MAYKASHQYARISPRKVRALADLVRGKFADEIHPDNKHTSRGIVSMANSGPNTNGSQFFITYARHPHLDNNYTVFGKVVGGFDALARIERVPTDKEDRPAEPVSISGITVLVDPFETLDSEMQAAHAREADPVGAAAADQARRAAEDAQAWYNGPISRPKALREGVGKYISTEHLQGQAPPAGAPEELRPPKRTKPDAQGYQLSNFSGW